MIDKFVDVVSWLFKRGKVYSPSNERNERTQSKKNEPVPASFRFSVLLVNQIIKTRKFKGKKKSK